MADINIQVDNREVIAGKRSLDDFGAAFGKLVARLMREERQLSKALESPFKMQEFALKTLDAKLQQTAQLAARENQKIINSNLGISESYKSAEDSAQAFLVVMQNQTRIARQFTESFNASMGIGRSAMDNGAGFSAIEAEIERLSMKYNSLYAASRLYESSLDELNRAHQLGAISTKQHEAAVENLTSQYQQFQNGTAGFGNVFAQQANMTAGRMNELGVVTQQLGYQVGDFLVQVQSGTNWMVAFGQQATQLVGVLPLMSTQLGLSTAALVGLSTVLGIGIPLVTAIGAAWMRTSKDTKDAADGVQTLDDKLKSLDQTLQNWLETKKASEMGITVEQLLGLEGIEQAAENMESARAAYQSFLETVQNQNFGPAGPGAGAAVAILNLFKEGNLQEAIAESERAYVESVQRVGVLQAKIISERIALFEQEQVKLRERQEIEIATARYGKESAQVIALVAAQERRRYEESLKSRIENEKMVKILMDQYDEGVRLVSIAENWKTGVDRVKSILDSINGMRLNVSLQIDTVVNNLPEWASGIYDKLYQTAGAITYGERALRPPPRAPNDIDFGMPPESTGGGSGGGGGGSGRLESLISELQTERETLEIWYEESQLLLQEASDRELEILGGKYEAKLRLEQEYQERLKEILGQETNYRLTEMGNMFSALADLAGVGGKKMLRVQATLSAAATTIAAYETAVKAAAEAKTIPGRIAAYAKFLAVGLGAVKQIRSAGGIGGGGGGPSSPNVNPAPEGPGPQTVFIDSIDPAGLYSGQSLINLFEAFYNENDRRGKVFVVARQ